MKTVNSITRPDKIYETAGNQPILVLCDDLNRYVCKYNRWIGQSAGKLIREYIAGSFAKLWNLAIPDFLFVNVKNNHIENFSNLQPSFFNVQCFGSKHQRHYAEIDNFYAEINISERKKYKYRNEFLKIALFDLWIANEDRNHNNYNLLIDVHNGNRFIPIDHDSAFNTGNLDKGLYLISEDESLIMTDITKMLFTKNEILDQDFINEFRDDFYICTTKCSQNVKKILADLPEEWIVDIHDMENLLNTYLFNNKWREECFNYFLKLLQHRFSK